MISKPQQRGAALITSLIIVLVISILGVAIGKQVISLQKSSSSHYDQTLSFINTESAREEAEATIIKLAYSAALPTYARTAFTNENWWQNEENWASGAVVTKNNAAITGTPTFIIEDMGAQQVLGMHAENQLKRRFLRITAKADGKGDAVSYTQSYYAIMDY